jgi:transcriptional regulator with XRE-family HTH domain
MPRPNPRDPETDLGAALGEALRDLRIDAGFRTQEDFSRASGYAREGISRVETGDTLPGTTMFEDWLDACQATGRERKNLTRMLKLARRARGTLLKSAEPYVEAEKKAAFLRLWALLLVPGLLQTRDYALAMFLAAGLGEDEATAIALTAEWTASRGRPRPGRSAHPRHDAARSWTGPSRFRGNVARVHGCPSRQYDARLATPRIATPSPRAGRHGRPGASIFGWPAALPRGDTRRWSARP